MALLDEPAQHLDSGTVIVREAGRDAPRELSEALRMGQSIALLGE